MSDYDNNGEMVDVPQNTREPFSVYFTLDNYNIKTNVYVVAGSIWDEENNQKIIEHFNYATEIFNNNEIKLEFRNTIYRVETDIIDRIEFNNTTVDQSAPINFELLEIPFLQPFSMATRKDTGTPFYILNKKNDINNPINIFFVYSLIGTGTTINEYPRGENATGYSTVFIAEKVTGEITKVTKNNIIGATGDFNNSTLAHEIGHVFGLKHEEQINNNLMNNDRSNTIGEISLTLEQKYIINNYLAHNPHQGSINEI